MYTCIHNYEFYNKHISMFIIIYFIYKKEYVCTYNIFYFTLPLWICSLYKVKYVEGISWIYLFSLNYSILINMKEDQDISLQCWMTTQLVWLRSSCLIWYNHPSKNCFVAKTENVWNHEQLKGEKSTMKKEVFLPRLAME